MYDRIAFCINTWTNNNLIISQTGTNCIKVNQQSASICSDTVVKTEGINNIYYVFLQVRKILVSPYGTVKKNKKVVNVYTHPPILIFHYTITFTNDTGVGSV